MLPAKYRLKNRKDFDQVFKQGRTFSNELLIIKYALEEKRDVKIGFSAGIKFSKKSSQRNKVKRWLREAVRDIVEKIKPGHHIILLINSKFPYKQMNHSLIKEKTKNLFGEAGLIK